MKTKNNKKSGFTLIELIISMVVLAVLIGGGIAGFDAYTARAAETNMAKDAKAIATAANVHMKTNGVTTVTAATLIGSGNYVEALSDGVSCSTSVGTTFTLTHADVNSGAAVTYVTATGREQVAAP